MQDSEDDNPLIGSCQYLSAGTLLVLAGLMYDHFASTALGDQWPLSHMMAWGHCNSPEYRNRDQWLAHFCELSIQIQRGLFVDPSMRHLLLSRASRADGLS